MNFAMILQILNVVAGLFNPANIRLVIALVTKASLVGADVGAVWHAILTHDLAGAALALQKMLADLGVPQAEIPHA